MKKILLAFLTLGFTFWLAAPAFAWENEKVRWIPNTCGADLVAPVAEGDWWIRISDESGVLYENWMVPGNEPYTEASPLTVGGFSHDKEFHHVTYEVAYAANHAEDHKVYTQRQANCMGTSGIPGRPGEGTPGPPGPSGPPGGGYDCKGNLIPPGGVPAVCLPAPVVTTCTSKRVFRLTVARRLQDDDVYGDDAGQKIVAARFTWRGADAKHERVVKHATAKLRTGTKKDTDYRSKRLRASASFRNVIAPFGQIRVIDESFTLANGHTVNGFGRKVRLCLSNDGDLNNPSDIPQNGHTNGEENVRINPV